MAWILRLSSRLHGSPASQSSCFPAQSTWPITILEEMIMTWSKPEFIDWRFGFEITLYIANR
jgi:coenzyme PQQ precursor peptide PqqA